MESEYGPISHARWDQVKAFGIVSAHT